MKTARRFNPELVAKGVVSSISNLCSSLDITVNDLQAARIVPISEKYERKEILKKDGSIRVVYKPHFLLRKVQRRLNRRFFSSANVIAWPDHIFGSVPNDESWDCEVVERDYVSCASQHCGARSLLSIDIKDFFDNIHRSNVEAVFRDFFHFPEDVVEALVDVCCFGNGILQGALTSSYLATLCLFQGEGDVVRKLGYKGLRYTRLVDDITISTTISNYDFSYAQSLVEGLLLEAGLPINRKKTQVRFASMSPLTVHGLRVEFSQPRLPSEEPRKLRAAVRTIEKLAARPGYRASRSYRKDFNRCMGRVNKLGRVKHRQHSELVARLTRILPLASHADKDRAEAIVARLEKDVAKRVNYQNSYWFYRRFFIVSERLNVLSRSFPHDTARLRKRLSAIRPNVPYE